MYPDRDMGPGVCEEEGNYFPFSHMTLQVGLTHTSRESWKRRGGGEGGRGASGHGVTPSGSPVASPRGPHLAAMWQRERARGEHRLNSHKCATPQLSLTAFNAVRADVRRA